MRPLSVTVLSWVLIVAGAVGLAYHLSDFWHQPSQAENLGVAALRIIAIVGGVYLLRGANWARWVAVAWIALHVAISIFHDVVQVAVHCLVLAIFVYVLFRPKANAFFRSSGR